MANSNTNFNLKKKKQEIIYQLRDAILDPGNVKGRCVAIKKNECKWVTVPIPTDIRVATMRFFVKC